MDGPLHRQGSPELVQLQPMSVLISSSPPVPNLFSSWTRTKANKPLQKALSSSGIVGTSGSAAITRKSVKFADALGFPLTQIKLLKSPSLEDISSIQVPNKTPLPETVPTRPGLLLNFNQPAGKIDFLEKVRTRHIMLENVMVDNFNITGTIIVHNIAYEKAVAIRYTKDFWLSNTEIPASFDRSVSPDLDKFTFKLILPPSLPPGARVEFCISYTVQGEVFWDNNGSRNYQIECKMLPVPRPRPLSAALPELYLPFRGDFLKQRYHMPAADRDPDKISEVYY